MKTADDLMYEFKMRVRLRKLSETPIIGDIIKAWNPYGMFTESLPKPESESEDSG